MINDEDEDLHHTDEYLPIEGHFTDIGDAEIVPPLWVIKDLLPVGLTFIIGPPKVSKKSTQAVAMAALTVGWENHLYPPYMRTVDRHGSAMIFSFEAEAGVVRHMMEKDMNTHGLTNDGSVVVADDPFMFRLDDEHGLRQLLFWLNARVPRIVIIDPFRNAHKADEKDSGAIFDIVNPLRKWAVKNEAAVVLVHHTNKINPDTKRDYTEMDARGTGAIFGAADGMMVITPIEEQGHVVKLKATFKRGNQGWERVLKLAVYQHKDRPAAEVFDAVTEKVYEAYQAGCTTMDEVATQVHAAKARVVAAVDTLVRNGLLVKNGKKVKVKK